MPHWCSDVYRMFAVKCSQATLEGTAIIAVLLALAIGFAIGRRTHSAGPRHSRHRPQRPHRGPCGSGCAAWATGCRCL